MKCISCGAENPDGAILCQMCGHGMNVQPLPRKENKMILVAAIAVVLLIALSIVLMPIIFYSPYSPPMTPAIAFSKGSNAVSTLWTLAAISGSASVLRSDVYVQVKNESGAWQITTIQLEICDGTNGFSYMPASTGLYLQVGDVFALSKSLYLQGSTITLVAPGATGQYAVLTV